MSYLLDKKLKRKKILNILLSIFVFFVLFYFRINIWNGLSFTTHLIFRPVLVWGNSLGEKIDNLGAYFVSKNILSVENEKLKAKLEEKEAQMINYSSLFAENEKLKEILGRKNENTSMVVSAILSRSNQNIYDSLIIDVGTNQGVKTEDVVFALGNVPIGRIAEAYPNSAKVVLFSNSGEKTQAIIPNRINSVNQPEENLFMELVGRGGGNFEMVLPRDIILQKGDQAIMPGINSYVLAVVETTISDPRDPFTKALFRSPVNVQNLSFVQVRQ